MSEIKAVAGWGRENGFVDVGSAVAALTQNHVMDRLLIQDAINRYGWSYDERDIAALQRCFAPDASYEGFVAGVGPFGPYEGREAILKWFTEYMAGNDDLRRHRLSNVTFVGQSANTARVIAYLALHQVSDDKASLLTSGFYRLDLEKRAGVWVFSRVFAGFDNSF